MDKKMKECFTPHAMTHSLMGVGIGLLLTTIFPGLSNMWFGIAIIVVAIVLDMMRK